MSMRPRIQSVKNPKRQFSRRHRRRDQAPDPNNVFVVAKKPRGFFAQHATHFFTYVAALAVGPLFLPKTVGAVLTFWVLSLFIPLLWVVRYRRTQAILKAMASDKAEGVTQELS
jgi:hypothetical protein